MQREVSDDADHELAADNAVLHFGDKLRDFSDTAALISLMDVVISVDTAVAHLAGAMGKPVWILLRFAADWRWLTERSDTRTARLFRQQSLDNWDPVIDQLRVSLCALAGERNRTSGPSAEVNCGHVRAQAPVPINAGPFMPKTNWLHYAER